MKKSTKGALAASAAAVLLMGGAGTLAFWSASEDLDGGSFTAGTLTLSALTCDTNWKYATGAEGAGTEVTLIVPGDKITKTCTSTIGATGDNLAATLTTPTDITYASTGGAGGDLSITPTVAYTLDDSALPVDGAITSDNDGDVLEAVFTVTIPYGTGETGAPKVNANDTQSVVTALDALTVGLVQTNPNP